ncbi:MAG: undecaprenyl phosphate translocase family protein [Anaerovoracaceae bacterium]
MEDSKEKSIIQSHGNRNRILLLILQGVIIGIGGILPGISGGVLCVIFGLYQPVIEVLSNPFANLKRHWRIIIPAGIGVGLGFLGCAGLVSTFMEKNSQAAVCVFIGLIVGMLPDLWKDAGREGRKGASLPALVISFLVFLGLLLFLSTGISMEIMPSTGWYVFCGIAWGLSIVVPGLSSSSMLIFFGLYQPMLEGMARLDFSVLIPLGIGACLIVFTLSRAVNHFFAKHYALASHIILGIVVATTVMIVPTKFSGTSGLLICLACAAGGVLAAAGLNRLCSRIAEQRMAENQ